MKILQIDGNGRIVAEWDSITNAANATNLDPSHISKCLRGKRATHGGYYWKYSEGEVCEESNSDFKESRSYDYKGDSAVLSGKTERPITSLEEALEFFEVDIDKWDVERYVINSWDVTGTVLGKRTNYQVKVWLKPKEIKIDEVLIDLSETLKDYEPRIININTKGKGILTAEFADFHIGADIKNLVRTPDFDVRILGDYLYNSTKIINSYNAESVVVNLHGDFIESMTGLNHDDSWKGLGKGMYGANVVIYASELLSGALLSNINNLKEINIISGNHDRMSAKRSVDDRGEIAKLLSWILEKDFPEVNIDFNSLILVKEIDGIVHIMTHGHHGISKRDIAKVVADYGDNKKFNLWTEGHLHTRSTKKVLKSKIGKYDTIDVVQLDEQRYRKITLPPMFTGNFFSESLGYSGFAGFVLTQNNGKGIPNIFDYTL